MWSEVKILVPPDALEKVFPASRRGPHADQARNITARLNELAGYPLPNRFFNYDEQGRPLGQRPSVRFGSFQAGISVQGVGREGCDLVESIAHHVRRLWSLHLGQPLTEHRYSGQCDMRWAERPVNYYVHQLLLDTPADWWVDHGDAKQRLMGFAADAIKRYIIAEAQGPHRGDPVIEGSEVQNELPDLMVHVTSMDAVNLKQINPGTDNKAVVACAKSVRFQLPVSLSGIWHVGRFTSRGFGKIRREFQVNQFNEHANPLRNRREGE